VHNLIDRTNSMDRNVRTDWRSQVELIDKSLLLTELVLVSIRPARTHPLQQFFTAEMEPNHCHGSTGRSVKSINESFPGVEILPFLGERSDQQHGVSDAKVVFGQAGDGLVPVSARERRQPWIVNVVNLDKRPNDPEQRLSRNVQVDQRCSKRPRQGHPHHALARRWRTSDQERCWPGVCGPHTENVAIDGNRSLR
jgi:hypothetical protein